MPELEAARSRNMRQLLLRASRVVNRLVVEGLHARGYAKLSAAHTTLLSNLDLSGGTVTNVARQAGISKQAMGRLAAELEQAGYLSVTVDATDSRVRVLTLTKTGNRLMLDSFAVMDDIERRYGIAIGNDRFLQVLDGLAAIIDVSID